MFVAVQLFVVGLYLPPVSNPRAGPFPPHTIISLPARARAGVSMQCRRARRRMLAGRSNCIVPGIVASLPRSNRLVTIGPAPDDHFTAGPHCRVLVSGFGCVGGAGGRPAVGRRIAHSRRCLGIRAFAVAAPDDHFTACPDCRVLFSGNGGASGAGVYPSIRCPGIVSPAGVRDETHISKSAPNNHFAAGPHSRVKVSSVRHVGGAGCCPRIRNAWSWYPCSRWCWGRRWRPRLARNISRRCSRFPGQN